MDLLESKRFSSLRLRILSAAILSAAATAATAAAADEAAEAPELSPTPRPLLSLWQQSLEAMDEATKLLFIKDLLFCRLPVDDFDFFDMVAAAATAALLFEIKA